MGLMGSEMKNTILDFKAGKTDKEADGICPECWTSTKEEQRLIFTERLLGAK